MAGWHGSALSRAPAVSAAGRRAEGQLATDMRAAQACAVLAGPLPAVGRVVAWLLVAAAFRQAEGQVAAFRQAEGQVAFPPVEAAALPMRPVRMAARPPVAGQEEAYSSGVVAGLQVPAPTAAHLEAACSSGAAAELPASAAPAGQPAAVPAAAWRGVSRKAIDP